MNPLKLYVSHCRDQLVEALLPVSKVVPVFLRPVFPAQPQLPDVTESAACQRTSGEGDGMSSSSAALGKPESMGNKVSESEWYHCPHCRGPLMESPQDSPAAAAESDESDPLDS